MVGQLKRLDYRFGLSEPDDRLLAVERISTVPGIDMLRNYADTVHMTTRISVDLEDDLYKRLKVHCALEKATIADVVRELLEKRFPKVEKSREKKAKGSGLGC